MKNIFSILAVFVILLFTSCNEIPGGPTCPVVKLDLVSVDSKIATVKWNNIGNDYSYSTVCFLVKEKVWVSGKDEMTTNDNTIVLKSPETKDTTFLIEGLSPNTEYAVSVETYGECESVGCELIYFRTQDE